MANLIAPQLSHLISVPMGWPESAGELRSEVPKYIAHCKSIGEGVASPTVMYAVRQRDARMPLIPLGDRI